MPPAERPRLDRVQRSVLAAILALALGLRLGYLGELSRDILFQHPVVDEDAYVEQARALVRGAPVRPEAYWQPPGVAYGLAAVFRVAGPGLTAPRVLNALLSTLCCLLLLAIARRFLPPRWALAATAATALHGVLVFSAAELMPPTYAMTLDLTAIWLLLLAAERRSLALAALAGLALGASVVCIPVVLVFAPVALLWLWRGFASPGQRRPQALALTAFVACLAAPIAAVTARNQRVGHELVMVSTNGGVNLHLGNHADYPTLLEVRPGRRWTQLVDEPLRAGLTRPGAKSAFFTRKALAWMAEHPGRAALLLGRKLALYFHGAEIPRDSDIYQARRDSLLMTVLVWPAPLAFPDGVLMPLALLGLVALWPRRREALLLWGFVLTQAAVVALFFVTSRYRVPALPLLCLCAALGARWLANAVRAQGRRAALALLGFAALFLLVRVPTRETRWSFAAELDFYRGLAYLRHLHQPLRAERAFLAAAHAAPDDARFWFELGNTRESLHNLPDAVAAWRVAAMADPWDVRPLRRVAFALTASGDLDGAIRALLTNVASRQRPAADYAHEHFNLGHLYTQQGDFARALAQFRAAAAADPAFFATNMRGWGPAALDNPALVDPTFWSGLATLLREQGLSAPADEVTRRKLAPPAPSPPPQSPPVQP